MLALMSVQEGEVLWAKEHCAREDRLIPFLPSITLVYWHTACCGVADKDTRTQTTCHYTCMQPQAGHTECAIPVHVHYFGSAALFPALLTTFTYPTLAYDSELSTQAMYTVEWKCTQYGTQ